MEIYEMKYFLEVARFGAVGRASQALNISPAAVSRAIGRMEEELGTALFSKDGRNIRITKAGLQLQKKLSLIVQLEEDARLSVAAEQGQLQVEIMAEEALHSIFSRQIFQQIQKDYPQSILHAIVAPNTRVHQSVRQRDVSLGLISGKRPSGLDGILLARSKFQLFCSSKHPLHCRRRSSLDISQVLEHDFVVSPHSVFAGDEGTFHDGWDERRFPRKHRYKLCSLSALRDVTTEGLALAFLPRELGRQWGFTSMKVPEAPSYRQPIHLICREKGELGWLKALFTRLPKVEFA